VGGYHANTGGKTGLATISSDYGVMEIGSIIDFHSSEDDNDFLIRLAVNPSTGKLYVWYPNNATSDIATIADLANYLPLDGSVPMSGATFGINSGLGEIYADTNAIAISSSGIAGDISTQRFLRIYSKTGKESSAEALQFIESTGAFYNVLHTGNSAKVVVSSTPLTAEGSIRVW
jgi:hypothetical protein